MKRNPLARALAIEKILVLLAAMIAGAALLYPQFSILRRVIAASEIRACAEQPVPSGATDAAALEYLRSCASNWTPEFVGTPEESLLLDWLLESRVDPARHYERFRHQLLEFFHGESLQAFLLLRALDLILLLGAVAIWKLGNPRSETRTADSPARTALVIDDNEAFAHGIMKTLRSQGFEVDLAHEPRQARLLLGSKRYDAIFCDYYLGNEHGTDVCEMMLDDEERKRCVIMSGGDLAAIRSTAPSGFRFLPKPCSGSDIARMIAV